jgi:PII-like signaling protein
VPLPDKAALMRIYTDERARSGHKSLFEAIVCKARDSGLAGATVLRGPMGFGHTHRIQNASILNLSGNLPLVIEIVDDEPKLRDFLSTIENMKDIGLVTLEKVEILHHGVDAPPAGQ